MHRTKHSARAVVQCVERRFGVAGKDGGALMRADDLGPVTGSDSLSERVDQRDGEDQQTDLHKERQLATQLVNQSLMSWSGHAFSYSGRARRKTGKFRNDGGSHAKR